MSLAVFDLEVDASGKIKDFGAVKNNLNDIHTKSITDFYDFIKPCTFLSGHNIINHDIHYLEKNFPCFRRRDFTLIDTLYVSPLLFPEQPYHALIKDDKLQTDDINNPRNDSLTAFNLLMNEIDQFNRLDEGLKQIYFLLLRDSEYFSGFFSYVGYTFESVDLVALICTCFEGRICTAGNITQILDKYPVELAYSLSIIRTEDKKSNIPPWVLKNFPQVNEVINYLRNSPCNQTCSYCRTKFDAVRALEKHFSYPSFRTYDGMHLQEEAVNIALHNRSLLAIFPTGGGKSITFQLPALVAGDTIRGLTVIISPLQSLMKDQVDNLEKLNITDAVTINGLIDPIERGKSYERIESGQASMLYISPESLRSKSIERLLMSRKIARFVIDEAHCFSSWGHDFRIDYLHIAPFIKQLQEKKQLKLPIQVSCFTATAKLAVVEDIKDYFKRELDLNLEVLSADTARKNLKYKVVPVENELEKKRNLLNIIQDKNCPTIVYVSRTAKANEIAEMLCKEDYKAKTFHRKMKNNDKIANQNAFINSDIQIIVATSAFGMGVDKKDVKLVVHYDISGSLENYVQEAGRAGRDELINADCYILYNEEDLNKHFILLNQTKISLNEVNEIWRAIKKMTSYKLKMSNSALEIARKAGWDDTVAEIETRVKTAISTLEQSNYLKRGSNSPRIYANSLLVSNAEEAIQIIENSGRFSDIQKVEAIRIIRKIISTKNTKLSQGEVGETRIDYIADSLGIVKDSVIEAISLLREEKILGDKKDISAFLYKDDSENKSLKILTEFSAIERFLLKYIAGNDENINLKSINQEGSRQGISHISIPKIKVILNYWQIKNLIKMQVSYAHTSEYTIAVLQDIHSIVNSFESRIEIARSIICYLFDKSTENVDEKNYVQRDFSVLELLKIYNTRKTLFQNVAVVKQIEETLFYISKIGAARLEGGFMVIYNSMTLERLETNNRIKFKEEDYKELGGFYEGKIQQIHIVGEYAKKMIENYDSALRFVNDYFQTDYQDFLKKYFPNNRISEISKTITPAKFEKIFGALSPAQLKIVNDNKSAKIVVGAGPGSGKTRMLVHKLASLLLVEDVKHEQLLMLTFSRSAVNEFKSRLFDLLGNAVGYIEIKTFHSFCFDLLGKMGDINNSGNVVAEAIQGIKDNNVELSKITKAVIVIDEAQDMNDNENELIKQLIEHNENLRILLVGDDDQNIYTFRGSASKYFIDFLKLENSKKYELLDNYRSKKNLIDFTNFFISQLSNRFKSEPIQAVSQENGNLKIIKHSSAQLVFPVVQDVAKSQYNGTTAVLTSTNEEALNVYGFLIRNNINAKLIQSTDRIKIFDLVEIRDLYMDLFDNRQGVTISNPVWKRVTERFEQQHRTSIYYQVYMSLIRNYEKISTIRKSITDFSNFLFESSFEDFILTTEDIIIVSTIHKSKGKEFDNVFLLLKNYNISDEERLRQLYVGMTRAKNNMHIHLNDSIFDDSEKLRCEYLLDTTEYESLKYIDLQLSFKTVDLGYFEHIQSTINHLKNDDLLEVSEDMRFLKTKEGVNIVRFSKDYFKTIEDKAKAGIRLHSASVLLIVYYTLDRGLETEREIKIVFPRIRFDNEKIIAETLIKKPIKSSTEDTALVIIPLFDVLRNWRYLNAIEKKLPAYTICTNATIENMIDADIAKKEDLLKVRGIGNQIYANYGDVLYQILTDYASGNFEALREYILMEPLD